MGVVPVATIMGKAGAMRSIDQCATILRRVGYELLESMESLVFTSVGT